MGGLLPDIGKELEALASIIHKGGIIRYDLDPGVAGSVIEVNGIKFYIDVINSRKLGGWGFILMTKDGGMFFVKGMGNYGNIRFVQRMEHMDLPVNLLAVEDINPDEYWGDKELFRAIREHVEKTVVFRDGDQYYDLLTAYVIMTWISPLLPRKPFLFVTGFYGTGKSVISSILREFARYPVELLGELYKSNLWALGIGKGIGIIDETDRISVRTRQTLRRMFDDGVEVSKMMADIYGFTKINLKISVPIAIIGTHLPSDSALLSRGYIIKMHYGKPEKSTAYLKNVAPEVRKQCFYFMLRHVWDIDSLVEEAYRKAVDLDMHQRSIDLYVSIYPVLKLCGVDDKFMLNILYDTRLYSYHTVLINRVLAYASKKITSEELIENGLIPIPTSELLRIIYEIASEFKLKESQVAYMTQYFISSAIPCEIDGKLGECFKLDDIMASLKFFAEPKIRVKTKRGED